MKRRSFLAISGLGLPAIASVGGCTTASAGYGIRRPNILLLFSDQHHAGAMGCAGNGIVQTSAMDSLAREGVRFVRAYCQDGICVPSRTSMLSGVYPRTTGCLDNPSEPPKPERYTMLHHILRQNGYVTGCFGKRHLPPGHGGAMCLGWDRSATTISGKQDPSDETYESWLSEKGLLDKYKAGVGENIMGSDLFCKLSQLEPDKRDAAYTADKSIEFLKRCKEDKKQFFCWATFHGPHHPYTPPKKWADLYPAEDMPLPANIDEPVEHLPPELRSWRGNEKRPWNLGTAAGRKELYKQYISYYYAQVTEVDHYMGRILDELESLGLREDTIVIYASDHGDFVGHHGMAEKCALGHNVYEDILRVPLIISWPQKFKKHVACDDLVELLDIYPTLVDLLGIKMPEGAQALAGISLVPTLVAGQRTGRKYAVSENWTQVSIVTENYKLGVWIDPGPLPRYKQRDLRGKFPDMLFDLRNDPLETKNLVGRQEVADVEKVLRGYLAEWQAKTPDTGRRELIEEWHG